MKLLKNSKEIKILFIRWVKNHSKLGWFEKLIIQLLFGILPFTYQFGMLCHFFDYYGIHIIVQPGRYLGGEKNRCYFRSIIGVRQEMSAWDTRREAEIMVIKSAISLFWKPKGTELRNKIIQERN